MRFMICARGIVFVFWMKYPINTVLFGFLRYLYVKTNIGEIQLK